MAAYNMSCYGFPVFTPSVGGGVRLEPSSQRMGPLGSLQPLPAGMYRGAVGGFAGLGGLNAIIPIRPPADLRGVGMGALNGRAWDRFVAVSRGLVEVGGAATQAGCAGIEDPADRATCMGYAGAAQQMGAGGEGAASRAVIEACTGQCFQRDTEDFTRCMQRCQQLAATADIGQRAIHEQMTGGEQPDLCDNPDTPAFLRAMACAEPRVMYGGGGGYAAPDPLRRKQTIRNVGAAVGGAAVAALLVKLLFF